MDQKDEGSIRQKKKLGHETDRYRQAGSPFSYNLISNLLFFTEKPLDCAGKGIPNTAIGNVMCMPFPVGTPHVAQEWYILYYYIVHLKMGGFQ